MTQTKICFKNKFGFCKYNERCSYQHVSTVCEDDKCDVYKCEKRHPRICRYYRDFKWCKFTVGCKFKHENQHEILEKLEKKIKEIKCDHKEEEVAKIAENYERKLESIEIKLENQRKEIEEKDTKIASLEIRLHELEKKFVNEKKAKERKLIDLENSIKSKSEKQTKDNFKCEHCDYETSSERVLNIHVKRKHTNLNTNNYPVECDFCDLKVNSESEMIFHLKNDHTSTDSSLKCLDCDFYAENEISIQVHQGRCHGGFECGICDFKADSLQSLDIHLNTCESFECYGCRVRVYNISDMKDHINEKHGVTEYLAIKHGKLDRKNKEYVKETRYDRNDL